MKTLMRRTRCVLLISFLLLSGCSEPAQYRAVYVLVDASIINADAFEPVNVLMRYLLWSLHAGESLTLARIDRERFADNEVVASMDFDLRPSMANAQKRAFLESVTRFEQRVEVGQYTDITGAILQAIESLNKTQAMHRSILILSDLKEQIKDEKVADFPISFNGIQVVSVRARRAEGEENSLIDYTERLMQWAERVEQGGGKWRIINNLEQVKGALKP